MFEEYRRPINPELKQLLKKIESEISASVLAGDYFRYNLRQTRVEVTYTEPREINILEEFVLRSAIELEPAPTETEIASMLGVDSKILKNSFSTLKALNKLEETPESTIVATESGTNLYNSHNREIKPKSTKELYAIYDYLSDKIYFLNSSFETENVPLELEYLGNYIELGNNVINIESKSIEEIREIIKNTDLQIHVPEKGKILLECNRLSNSETIRRKVAIFLFYDDINAKLFFKVYDGEQELKEASNRINQLKDEEKFDWQQLFKLSDESIEQDIQIITRYRKSEVDERINQIRQKARESKAYQVNGDESNTITLLRGSNIYQAFINTLMEAQHQIMIYSPWINEGVVNEQFIAKLQTLANRGVWILIGYGIADSENNEDRKIKPDVKASLQNIHTPEGLPAVQIYWFGSSHAKEIIVDKKIHLCGSNNFLSCRAGRTWDEAMYKVGIPSMVEQAYDFYANNFKDYAEKLWNEALENKNIQLAKKSIYIWSALGMEQKTFDRFDRLRSKWYCPELICVWLKCLCQRLRSQPSLNKSLDLSTVQSLLKDIEAENSIPESIHKHLIQVANAIEAR